MCRVIRSSLIVCAAFLFSSAISSAQITVTYGYSGLPQFIYGDAADVITIVNVFVPQGIKMTAVTARLKIEYPETGDLKVYLFSPAGTRTILTDHDCGALPNIDTTFADNGSGNWKEFCPTEAGRGPFRPDEPMTNFNADDSAFGTWRLTVENDQSDSRTGWIDEFALTITGAQQTPIIRPETISNAANPAASGSIAPGELLSIYGVGVGPTTPVTAAAGLLPTTLGGVQVVINGAAVPIAYASFYRVDVQAPFNLTTGSPTAVQLSVAGTANTNANVNVVDAVPALYTNQPGGGGRITAVNQSGTTNSSALPADKGSVITVYANGLGVTNPPLNAGTPPPSDPLSFTIAPVTAVIGGISAPVVFAGAAPGFPGLYQLNVQIPATAPSGAQELRIYVNGTGSQAGVTVSIQ